ncbi:fimbrial protein [Serratia marcescens]|uniref:Fimbrial protein n=2 Tax=Serratia marcescens TaxID=615 RepID=A0ABD6HRN3_SERMA|nr:fimbrial protein [Serratia marcescens]MDT0204235.1 fimbrial protein [Serratia marcescens]MVF04945.1 fimbrial protein [Serratia marcescens]
MLLAGVVWADSSSVITIKVTVVAPACVINNNQPITVEFGDVVTTRIDGYYKRQLVRYSVVCKNLRNPIKLQIQGAGAGFNSAVLRTNKEGLGVALLHDSYLSPLGSWINFNYPNLPVLHAVPVKQAGVQLDGGAFSAGATMKVEYQ